MKVMMQEQMTYERDKHGCFVIKFRGKVVEVIDPSLDPKIAMRMVELVKKVERITKDGKA